MGFLGLMATLQQSRLRRTVLGSRTSGRRCDRRYRWNTHNLDHLGWNSGNCRNDRLVHKIQEQKVSIQGIHQSHSEYTNDGRKHQSDDSNSNRKQEIRHQTPRLAELGIEPSRNEVGHRMTNSIEDGEDRDCGHDKNKDQIEIHQRGPFSESSKQTTGYELYLAAELEQLAHFFPGCFIGEVSWYHHETIPPGMNGNLKDLVFRWIRQLLATPNGVCTILDRCESNFTGKVFHGAIVTDAHLPVKLCSACSFVITDLVGLLSPRVQFRMASINLVAPGLTDP